MLSLARRTGGGRAHPRATPASTVPANLGLYQLCMEIESGGMATVYLARCARGVSADRLLALKVIHPHLANDKRFIQMFHDEAEIASRIQHANVCRVFDYGVGEWPYIAMEYLLGEPLMSVWRRAGRERGAERAGKSEVDRHARRVARVLADACDGLHAAHELKDGDGDPLEVVHRDVSPENVFLTYDGIVKIVDFGVASAARKRHRTRTGMIKGKFAYVAPELLQGKRRVDRRVDVWGVGVLAWELLTARRLFRRESEVDTLRAVMSHPIESPSAVRPSLPPELDDVVMRALSRDPDERYATARELGRDLARVAAGGEAVVAPSDLAEWMEELFPGGRERQDQILELAAQVADPEHAPPPSPGPHHASPPETSEEGQTLVMPRPTPPPPDATPRRSAEGRDRRAESSTRAVLIADASWSRPWLLVAAMTLAATGAGAGYAWVDRSGAAAKDSGAADGVPMVDPGPTQPPVPVTAGAVRATGGSVELVRGPYVVQVDQAGDGEVILRVRLDDSPQTAAR